MFYYTYNNEEDLYIHSQDPFRNNNKNEILHCTHKAQAHTQRVGGVDATHHTCRLFGRWMFGTAQVGVLNLYSTDFANFQLAHSQVTTYNL